MSAQNSLQVPAAFGRLTDEEQAGADDFEAVATSSLAFCSNMLPPWCDRMVMDW